MIVTCVVIVQATGTPHLHALARMTGNDGKGGSFGQLRTYLDNRAGLGSAEAVICPSLVGN